MGRACHGLRAMLVFRRSTVVEGEGRLARNTSSTMSPSILRDKAIDRQIFDMRIDLHMRSMHVGRLLLSKTQSRRLHAVPPNKTCEHAFFASFSSFPSFPSFPY